MYMHLTPEAAVCSAWRPCWPRPGQRLLRLAYSRTFPISHPSTRLCLELLREACQERAVLSLLDVGCGSGILALTGALLGVPWNVGCDPAAAALRVSQANARRNRLEDPVSWVQGSTEALRGTFDLVVANLPFPLQVAKRTELLRLVDGHGRVILSGFRDTQEQELTDFYLSQAWRLQRRLTRERWEPEVPAELSYTWVGLYFVPAGSGPLQQ
ncbi:MAG: methyltransferase [Deltaproteobacteria bacterium]|nr:methyltransferase [Deltaproteobacteria bacterium]